MNQQQPNLVNFIGLGIFIVLMVASLFVFSYLLLVGAVVGLVLFIVNLIRQKFTKHKLCQQPQFKFTQHRGRTIDHQP